MNTLEQCFNSGLILFKLELIKLLLIDTNMLKCTFVKNSTGNLLHIGPGTVPNLIFLRLQHSLVLWVLENFHLELPEALAESKTLGSAKTFGVL